MSTAFISWVRGLVIGEHEVGAPGVKLQVTPQLLSELSTQTNALIAALAAHAPPDGTPYQLPVLREHAMDGEVEGSILTTKVGPDGQLYLKVHWTSRLWGAIQANAARYVSVRLERSYVTSWGESFGPVITEVSVTASPRLDVLGSIQDTLNLQLSRGKTMDPEILGQTLAAILEGLQALAANQAEILKALAGNADAATPVETDEVIEEIEMAETEEEAATEDEQMLSRKPMSEATAQKLAAALASHTQLLSRLSPGAPAPPIATPSAPRVKTYDDVLALGRAEGKRGAALGDWAFAYCAKHKIAVK